MNFTWRIIGLIGDWYRESGINFILYNDRYVARYRVALCLIERDRDATTDKSDGERRKIRM